LGAHQKKGSSAVDGSGNDSDLVIWDALSKRGVRPSLESTPPGVSEHRQRPATSTANHQVVPPITIQIAPGNAGPELAEFARQERLTGKIVEVLLQVRVGQQAADVFEERLWGVLWRWRCRFGSGFSNLVNVVGDGVGNEALLAAAPSYVD